MVERDNMDEKELIKYLKTLIAVTKDSNVKMKELETGVEISVEMAEQLIGIIEKLRIKNGKEFVRGMETERKVWETKIKSKIKELYEDKDSKYYDMFLNERDIEKTISILKDLKGE